MCVCGLIYASDQLHNQGIVVGCFDDRCKTIYIVLSALMSHHDDNCKSIIECVLFHEAKIASETRRHASYRRCFGSKFYYDWLSFLNIQLIRYELS